MSKIAGRVKVLDSTLREGEQTPGVYFDVHIKLAIANLLNEIGVDIIEAGHPSVSLDTFQTVRLLSEKSYSRSIIGAHSRAMMQDVHRALESNAGFLGVFYCVSNDRLTNVFKTTLKAACQTIADVISHAKTQNPNLLVRFTPEDTVRTEFDNLIEAATAAVDAGADIISIADTTGCMVPGTRRNMYEFVSRVIEALARRGVTPEIAVHCHNDRGLALANALEGVRAGATIIDASVQGLGERAGIVDLAQILTVLSLDYEQTDRWALDKLPKLYQLVSQHSKVKIPQNFPLIGANAFTHCAGVHTHAASQNPRHYESIDPGLFGRERGFALDHMSGLSSVKYALNLIGQRDRNPEEIQKILSWVKAVGKHGRVIDLFELEHIVDLVKHVG